MIEYTVKVNEDGNEDGNKEWYLNGKLHREDGPAVEWANGNKSWYLNGKLHREDGPAVEWANGYKKWYLNGNLHREDGPACEWADGDKFWYLNGKCLSEKEWKKRTKKTHKIIIDGKEIELSDESFQNLKKAFDNS